MDYDRAALYPVMFRLDNPSIIMLYRLSLYRDSFIQQPRDSDCLYS